MNIIIYTLIILTIFVFFIKWFGEAVFLKENVTKCKNISLFIGFIAMQFYLLWRANFYLTLPLTLASLALVKLKGLSFFQLFSLFRLIQTLRQSGRFSFNNSK